MMDMFSTAEIHNSNIMELLLLSFSTSVCLLLSVSTYYYFFAILGWMYVDFSEDVNVLSPHGLQDYLHELTTHTTSWSDRVFISLTNASVPLHAVFSRIENMYSLSYSWESRRHSSQTIGLPCFSHWPIFKVIFTVFSTTTVWVFMCMLTLWCCLS